MRATKLISNSIALALVGALSFVGGGCSLASRGLPESSSSAQATPLGIPYLMQDGTEIVLEDGAPVPQEVLDDVTGLTSQFDTTLVNDPAPYYEQLTIIKDKLAGTRVISILRSVALLSYETGDPNAAASPCYMLIIDGKEITTSVSHDEAITVSAAEKFISENGGSQAGWQILKHY